MELEVQWHDPKQGALDLDEGRWRLLRDGQDSGLHISLSRLSPGRVELQLRCKRRLSLDWREVSSARLQEALTVQQVSSEACALDLQLSAADLGMLGGIAARTLEVRATLHGARGSRDQVTRRVYLMPYRQFVFARWLRFCAFLPILPLIASFQADEISGDLAAWYAALSVGLGLVVQEHPISRISALVRGATRGVLPALLAMGVLIALQWSLLVRVTNTESSPIVVAGAPLDSKRSRVTWRWRAPTLQSLDAESGGTGRFTLEPVRFGARASDDWSNWAPWRTLALACKPFRVACAREPADSDCCGQVANAAKSCEERPDAKLIKLGPNCSIPERVRSELASWIVLGRAHAKEISPQLDGLDALPACAGTYEVELSEQAAYAGDAKKRAQNANSYAIVVVPDGGQIADMALHWTNSADTRNGFVAATVTSRDANSPACVTMIPVRNGSFEIELRGAGGGTLRCPSVGSCKTAYALHRVFSVKQPEFDGLQFYSLDHGRSVWTPLGDSVGAFECGCWNEQQPPKQATLRLTRRAPQGLRLEFEANALPPRIDISAADQRSTLQCGLERTQRVSVQPLKLGYTDKAERVEVTRSSDKSAPKWPSEWTWLEGEHQAWSCTGGARELSVRVDKAQLFDYQHRPSGADSPKLPVCYLHPSGRVASQPEVKCGWDTASPEYAKLVLRDHVCAEVKACLSK